MTSRLRSAVGILLLAVFLPLELLAGMPAFHRHSSSNDLFPERGAASGPAIGERVDSPRAPFDCPACTVSGFSAVAALGVAAVAPTVALVPFVIHLAAAGSSPDYPASRGRAPPLA